MHPEAREELRVRFKKTVLEIAAHIGVTKTSQEFAVARSTFYEWRGVAFFLPSNFQALLRKS